MKIHVLCIWYCFYYYSFFIHKKVSTAASASQNMQMQPSFIPSMETPNGEHENSRPVVSQLWKKRGSCPKGTIPIRRIRRRELLRTNGRKSPERLDRTNKTASQDRFMYLNNTRDSILYPTPENRSVSVLLKSMNLMVTCTLSYANE